MTTTPAKDYSKFSHQSKVNRMRKLMGGNSQADEIQWDDEALWSFTPLNIGDQLCRHLKHIDGITSKSTITDFTASVGGNTIAFAHQFKHVNAVEPNQSRYEMLKNNLRVMKKKNVKTYNGDCQEYMNILEQDIVYFDPPWGGTDYKNAPMGTLRLQLTDRDDEKMDLEDIIIHMRDKASVCVVKLPVNYDVNYLEEKIQPYGEIVKRLEYERPNTMLTLIIKYN